MMKPDEKSDIGYQGYVLRDVHVEAEGVWLKFDDRGIRGVFKRLWKIGELILFGKCRL